MYSIYPTHVLNAFSYWSAPWLTLDNICFSSIQKTHSSRCQTAYNVNQSTASAENHENHTSQDAPKPINKITWMQLLSP